MQARRKIRCQLKYCPSESVKVPVNKAYLSFKTIAHGKMICIPKVCLTFGAHISSGPVSFLAASKNSSIIARRCLNKRRRTRLFQRWNRFCAIKTVFAHLAETYKANAVFQGSHGTCFPLWDAFQQGINAFNSLKIKNPSARNCISFFIFRLSGKLFAIILRR